MGNPHVVFFVDAPVATTSPPARARLVEHHPLFPQGVNVGFAHIAARDHIQLKVWERGAGLTAACGTGACAAQVAAVRRGLTDRVRQGRVRERRPDHRMARGRRPRDHDRSRDHGVRRQAAGAGGRMSLHPAIGYRTRQDGRDHRRGRRHRPGRRPGLRELGMNVVMADIMGRALKKAADAIGDNALAVPTDVADRAAVQALRDAAIETFGASTC
jgi:hypothetical protein